MLGGCGNNEKRKLGGGLFAFSFFPPYPPADTIFYLPQNGFKPNEEIIFVGLDALTEPT